jgi:rSAM/selenodomain-associated transferase 1
MKSDNESTVRFANQNCTLVIMAKAPRPGLVKTRLSQSLPSSAITELYRCLLKDTVSLARSLPGVEIAIMCPESDKDELAQFLGNTVRIVTQEGKGLAAGLVSVFAQFTAPRPEIAAGCDANTGRQRVIAFNSDSPHLSPSVLDSAFATLATRDLVIGPTQDGGYYLVGAKVSHPTLFDNDGLGTSNALERLLARARALKLSTGLTETFYDIDVADDLIRLAPELLLAPARAPRTAAWFAEWEQAVGQLRVRTGEL